MSVKVDESRRHLPVDGRTLPDAYLRRLQVSGTDRLFLYKRGGSYHEMTWNAAHGQVLGIFQAYQKMGLKAGDKICILGQTRPEWWIVDIANLCAGIVTVPIYYSNSVDDVTFILEDCEAKAVFAEDEPSCAKLAEAFKRLGKQLPVITFDDLGKVSHISDVQVYDALAKAPTDAANDKAFKAACAAVQPKDMASIVYTSGTTGRPKGVVLLHECFASELRAVIEEIELRSDDLTTTFLPFAHIFGRVESLMPIFAGITLGFAESVNTVAQNITEIKPTLLVSVPRIYEKIYAKIQGDVESGTPLKKKIFRWAVEVGREVARRRSEKLPIPLPLAAKHRIADGMVFTKIRAKMGGRLRMTVSGGAPLSGELCQLFHACGIKIMEGYGLTETTAAVTVNRPDDYSFGTVGKPLPGAEIRIAEDGEIQTRGPVVFREYYKNKEATDEVFTSDGWFCTGDIGEFTNRGFLKITDRKKELIVTSGGKKIAPQKLENMLKSSRFISNGLVFGDKQKYLVALVTLNEPQIKDWAKAQGLSEDLEAIAKDDRTVALIEGEIKGMNSQLASFESLKKFRILPKDFTVETGELTPSLKVKRKVCVERFKTYIDSMY